MNESDSSPASGQPIDRTETIVRSARREDASDILSFIRGLAEYEREPDQVLTTVNDIERQLFEPQPPAEVLIAEQNGDAVGFALFFATWSTWTGKSSIHLEDLFVNEASRGTGAGLALMRALAHVTRDRKCARLEWSVLDWNEPSIAFYRGIGAAPMDEWTNWRMDEAVLEEFTRS